MYSLQLDGKGTVSKNILVIDDDVTSLDIVSYFFEKSGYTVRRCVSGKQAIEDVKQDKPELIIVDLLMPELNGVETVKQLRREGLGAVPIVAFTAVDDHKMHDDALKAGCNVVLTKPCPAEKLLKNVQKLLPGVTG